MIFFLIKLGENLNFSNIFGSTSLLTTGQDIFEYIFDKDSTGLDIDSGLRFLTRLHLSQMFFTF